MILIKDLGYKKFSYGKKRFGIFACPLCHEEKERWFYTKALKCAKCENKAKTIHGKAREPIYKIWTGMKQRCYNKADPGYKHCGAHWICVYDDWKNSFKSFYQWASNNGYEKGLSIDRIDKYLDYHPDNCRFIKRIRRQNTQKKDSSTRYKGVFRFENSNKNPFPFVAMIKVDDNIVHLGVYNTALKAAKAYDNYVKTHNLEHTCNFLDVFS